MFRVWSMKGLINKCMRACMYLCVRVCVTWLKIMSLHFTILRPIRLISLGCIFFRLFGLVWFLFYGPSTHFRSFRARSVTLTTLYQYLVNTLSLGIDNCSSWISGRGRMAVEIFSWPNLHERMCRTCAELGVWTMKSGQTLFELRHEKTCLRDFRPGKTQIGLRSRRS